MTRRRDFLAQLGVLATAMAIDPEEMRASASTDASTWDTSWLKSLATAKYRAVFNASDVGGGIAMAYVSTFLDQFHEVHDTTDAETRPVIVFRRLGTQMAFNDALWERQAIGEELKINDPATTAPAKRNVFWSAPPGASARDVSTRIGTLQQRGLICLVCNVSVHSISYRIATATHRDVEEVAAEIRANLIPGAILVPSGIYALIRAQNAGCAFMQGT